MTAWDPNDLEHDIKSLVNAVPGTGAWTTMVEAMWVAIAQGIATWGVTNGGFGAGGGGGGVASVTAGSSKVSIGGTLANPTVDVVPGNLSGIPESGITGLVSDLTSLGSAISALASSLASIAMSGSANDLVGGTVPAARMPAHTGDVTSSVGTVALAIGVNKVLDTMLRQGAALSLVGNATNAPHNVADIVASGNGQFPLTAGGSLAFADFPTQVALKVPYLGVFGTGVDGSVTFDGTSTITVNGTSFAPDVNQRYLLTRDVEFVNCTINSGVIVVPSLLDNEKSGGTGGSAQAHRIFCTGTLTVNGKIRSAGNGAQAAAITGHGSINGVGGASSVSGASGAQLGTGAGGSGTGTPAASASITNHLWFTTAATPGGTIGNAGGNGGTYMGGGGGASATFAGGATGSLTTLPIANQSPRDARALTSGFAANGTSILAINGGGVGGGGGAWGGTVSQFGGPGGGSGGIIVINAFAIAGSGTIEASGGDGSNGGTNAGGGAGGPGGTIVITCPAANVTLPLANFTSTGGAAGLGNGTGKNGGAGGSGRVFFLG